MHHHLAAFTTGCLICCETRVWKVWAFFFCMTELVNFYITFLTVLFYPQTLHHGLNMGPLSTNPETPHDEESSGGKG